MLFSSIFSFLSLLPPPSFLFIILLSPHRLLSFHRLDVGVEVDAHLLDAGQEVLVEEFVAAHVLGEALLKSSHSHKREIGGWSNREQGGERKIQ